MKLHLPKLLLAAVGAAICCVHQAEADTYYLNVADTNAAALSGGVANVSGGSNIANAWKELCSNSDSYHNGPHKLVIDQARTATNYIKLDFSPLTVASLEVAKAASGTWISNSGTREYHVGDLTQYQESVFHGDLKLTGTGTKIVGSQKWTIDEGVTVTLDTTTVTSVSGTGWDLSGKGNLDASTATTINLGCTVSNAETTVKLGSATINLQTHDILLGNFERDLVVENGGVTGNGYVTGVSNVIIFSNASNVTSSGNLTYMLDGAEVSVTNHIVETITVQDGYYMVSTDEDYSSTTMADATTILVQNGAKLTMNENLLGTTTGGILLQGTTAVVEIGKDVTLSKNSVATTGESFGKLTGTGTYDLGDIDSISLGAATLADTWSGIVAAKQGDRGINLTNWNAVKSKIRLEGFTGYLSDADLTNDLELVNSTGADGYALRLDNGSSTADTTATFSGAISGSGNIEYTWDIGNTNKTTHVISGDTSQWDGKFLRKLIDSTGVGGITEGKYVDVKFTKGGDVFKANGNGGVADADSTRNKMNVIIEAATATTFNGSIKDVNAVTVNSDTTFKQQVEAQSLTLAAGKSMGVDAAISTTGFTLGENAGLVFGGGKLSVVNALDLDSTIITLAQDMEFATAEDYELLTVTGEGNTLSVTGWENWVGSTYNIGGVDYSTGLSLANNTLSVRFTAMPIPEPATATLSLLALVGLAARRRRK